MTIFTTDEKKFLLFMLAVFLVGNILKVSLCFMKKRNLYQNSAMEYLLKTKKVDINRATYRQLALLPGVSAKSAHKILVFREQKGKFERLEELKEVLFLPPKTMQKVLDILKVEP